MSLALFSPCHQLTRFAGAVTQAAALAVTVAVEVLAPGPGAVSLAATEAVLEIVPGVVGLTVIVTVAIAPLASEPIPHVTVPLACVQPELETNVTLPGKTSVTVEPLEFDGPLLVTLIV